jgi:hypothetical protein
MDVTLAIFPHRHAADVQSRRRGKLLVLADTPPRKASQVVPKSHKKSRGIFHSPAFCRFEVLNAHHAP